MHYSSLERPAQAGLSFSADRLPSRAVPKSRLDALLVDRGLFETRSRAAAAVLAGEVRLGERRAEKPGQMVAGDIALVRRRGAALRLTRGDEAGERARDVRHRRLRPRGAGRRSVDRGLHRLPAAARRRAGDRSGRRLRRAGLEDPRRRARDRHGAGQCARRPARRSALPARSGRDRRVVHLAAQGAAGRARCGRRGPVRLPGDDQAAVRGRPRAGRQGRRGALARRPPQRACRGRRVRRRPGGVAARRTRRRACPGRPGTRSRSSGSPRPGAPARYRTSRPRRERWSREHDPAEVDHDLLASARPPDR